MSAKRKRLSLDEKRDILRRLDSGQRQVDVAKAFGIPASSLSTIKSQRQAIAAASESAQLGPARKRLCTGYFSKVDNAVATWLKDLRARNIPVSGNMIQEKALEFAALFDVTGFDASSGWLHRFRARYGIVWKQVCGEASSADTAAASTWREEKLRDVMSGYSPDDVYNADETGVFYQLLPNKTMCYKDDTCKGGKHSKVRITALFCCNASGTHKMKPLIIGRYARPRCFKGLASLPCDYTHNSKAWMSRELFTKWIVRVNNEMADKNRKILLILDNCSAHLVDTRLSNIRVEFLPPNCTSILQPLDLGIIKNVKVHYRKRLVQRILINLRMNKPDPINVRQAAEMLTGAWWTVKPATIVNCWQKAGVSAANWTTVDANLEEEEQDIDGESSEPDGWKELSERLGADSPLPFEDYAASDSQIETCATLTTEEIVASALPQEEEEEEEESTLEEEAAKISGKEALMCLEKLKAFAAQQTAVPEKVHESLDTVTQFTTSAVLNAQVQQKITAFYTKC